MRTPSSTWATASQLTTSPRQGPSPATLQPPDTLPPGGSIQGKEDKVSIGLKTLNISWKIKEKLKVKMKPKYKSQVGQNYSAHKIKF